MKKRHPSKVEIAARLAAVIVIVGVAAGGAFISGGVPIARAATSWCGTYFEDGDTTSIEPDPGTHYGIITWDNHPGDFVTGDDAFYADVGQDVLGMTDEGDMGGIDVLNNSGTKTIRVIGVDTLNSPSSYDVLFTLSPGEDDHIPDGVYFITIDQPTGAVGEPDISVTLGKSCPATATPTAPAATPFFQPTACVTATARPTATRQATPTGFVISTPTPTRTPTPGGPTATPGPSATGTPLPSFDSGVATFAQSLQPWTFSEQPSIGGVYLTEWRETAGPDGNPGVAFMKDIVGIGDTPSVLTTTEPLSGSLTYSRPVGMFLPLRVTGAAKWSDVILPGESVYLRAWYYDPDYISVGQGAWVTEPPHKAQFSSAWGSISVSVSQHGGSGRVTAVAISEEIDGDIRTGEGALLDNLRVYSGPTAVNGSFPTCQGSGGVGSSPIQTKVCIINQIPIDVYGDCDAPDSVIDVVGWLAYLYCRLVIYFKFLNENRQQLSDLIARQNLDEPFGTFIEAGEVTGVFTDILHDISSINDSNALSYRTIEWSTLWNFRQLDDLATLLHKPVSDPTILQQLRSRCPAFSEDGMNTKLFRDYGCLVFVFVRDRLPIFGVWQWLMDGASLIGVMVYAYSILFKKSA